MNILKITLTLFLVGALVSGCGTVPERLARPSQISCVYLGESLSLVGTHGLGEFAWETRIERGPYVSEREDQKGTYYRAPPGGVHEQIVGTAEAARDGGFYIPKNANETPRVYYYFSMANAPVQIPPEDANCSNIGYISDPSGSKLDLVSVGVGGAVGGAAGGVIGHAIAGGGAGYGQAAGVGAAGGLIGTLLVAEMVNADVGSIHFSWDLKDSAFIAKLRESAAHKVPIKEILLNLDSQ